MQCELLRVPIGIRVVEGVLNDFSVRLELVVSKLPNALEAAAQIRLVAYPPLMCLDGCRYIVAGHASNTLVRLHSGSKHDNLLSADGEALRILFTAHTVGFFGCVDQADALFTSWHVL